MDVSVSAVFEDIVPQERKSLLLLLDSSLLRETTNILLILKASKASMCFVVCLVGVIYFVIVGSSIL
jgi:hypothetical protein